MALEGGVGLNCRGAGRRKNAAGTPSKSFFEVFQIGGMHQSLTKGGNTAESYG